MLDGRYRAPLLEQVPGTAALARITEITARKVFVSDGDYERDLGADRVIQALMDRTAMATDQGLATYDRALAVTDRVSGMTDSYAMQQFTGDSMTRTRTGGISGFSNGGY